MLTAPTELPWIATLAVDGRHAGPLGQTPTAGKPSGDRHDAHPSRSITAAEAQENFSAVDCERHAPHAIVFLQSARHWSTGDWRRRRVESRNNSVALPLFPLRVIRFIPFFSCLENSSVYPSVFLTDYTKDGDTLPRSLAGRIYGHLPFPIPQSLTPSPQAD